MDKIDTATGLPPEEEAAERLRYYLAARHAEEDAALVAPAPTPRKALPAVDPATPNAEIVRDAYDRDEAHTVPDLTWHLGKALRMGLIAPSTYMLDNQGEVTANADRLAREAFAEGWHARGRMEREVDDLADAAQARYGRHVLRAGLIDLLATTMAGLGHETSEYHRFEAMKAIQRVVERVGLRPAMLPPNPEEYRAAYASILAWPTGNEDGMPPEPKPAKRGDRDPGWGPEGPVWIGHEPLTGRVREVVQLRVGGTWVTRTRYFTIDRARAIGRSLLALAHQAGERQSEYDAQVAAAEERLARGES